MYKRSQCEIATPWRLQILGHTVLVYVPQCNVCGSLCLHWKCCKCAVDDDDDLIPRGSGGAILAMDRLIGKETGYANRYGVPVNSKKMCPGAPRNRIKWARFEGKPVSPYQL